MRIRNLSLILFIVMVQMLSAKSMSLKDIWDTAQKQNLTLKQQELRLISVHKDLENRQADFYPTLTLNSMFNYTSVQSEMNIPIVTPFTPNGISSKIGSKERYDNYIQLQQPLFTGFRLSNMKKANEAQYAGTQQQTRLIENQIYYTTGQIYYQIESLKMQKEVITKSVERSQIQLSIINSLIKAKQAIPFDTLEIANRILLLKTQTADLQSAQLILEEKLGYLLNLNEKVETTGVPANVSVSDTEMMASFEQTIQTRPEFKILDAQIEAQSSLSKVQKSQYYPNIVLNSTYHYGKPGANTFDNSWDDYYTIGLGLQWELWNWNKTNRKVAQSNLEIQKLQLQKEQQISDVKQQLSEIKQIIANTLRQTNLQNEYLLQETKRYQIIKERYQNNQATLLELNLAEKNIFETELKLKINRINIAQNKLQYYFITGEINR